MSVTSRPAFVSSPPTTHPIAPAPMMPILGSMPLPGRAGRSRPAHRGSVPRDRRDPSPLELENSPQALAPTSSPATPAFNFSANSSTVSTQPMHRAMF
jgi:hypothetical protein